MTFNEKDEDLDIIYEQLLQEYGAITFEAFINLLVCLSEDEICALLSMLESNYLQVDITEDQTSPDQLRDAFQGAASNKVCLDHFLIRESLNCVRVAVCDGTGFAPGSHTR